MNNKDIEQHALRAIFLYFKQNPGLVIDVPADLLNIHEGEDVRFDIMIHEDGGYKIREYSGDK